jgi:hypothetical protein
MMTDKYKNSTVEHKVDKFLKTIEDANKLLLEMREIGIFVNIDIKEQQIVISNVKQTIEYYKLIKPEHK